MNDGIFVICSNCQWEPSIPMAPLVNPYAVTTLKMYLDKLPDCPVCNSVVEGVMVR